MTNVWVVRAYFGQYAENFVAGGYVGAGWINEEDLSAVKDIAELRPIYRRSHPDQTSNYVVGANVGMLARFLFDIKAGDYVITPAADTERLHYGQVAEDPSYYYLNDEDVCPFRHRRRTAWEGWLRRSEFSVPFQNTLRAARTVFEVSYRDEFLGNIKQVDLALKPKAREDPYRVVLERMGHLHPAEFETLIGDLLTALGFEGVEITGKTGDGGVDVIGELNESNLVKVKVFVQAKSYKNRKVKASDVKKLRQSIPAGGQGAVITTSEYHAAARDVADEIGFPRVGLINGHQLVDLLIEHWDSIPEEFREKLGLKPGLVLR